MWKHALEYRRNGVCLSNHWFMVSNAVRWKERRCVLVLFKHHTKGTGPSGHACQPFVWCVRWDSGVSVIWLGDCASHSGYGSIGSCLPAPGEMCGSSFILLQGVRESGANRCKVFPVNTNFCSFCALTLINLCYAGRRMLIEVHLCIKFDVETCFGIQAKRSLSLKSLVYGFECSEMKGTTVCACIV